MEEEKGGFAQDEQQSENGLKKQFTTVTSFSKYAMMVLFVALPFVGFWLGLQFSPNTEIRETINTTASQDTIENIKSESSLVPEEETGNNIVGTISIPYESQRQGTFTGFHTTFEQNAWGVSEKCNGLVVSSGDEALTNHFKAMVERGNTVQSVDDKNRLILNLPWESIPKLDREKIQNSTEKNKISVTLKEKILGDGGAAFPCESFFTYVGISDDATI